MSESVSLNVTGMKCGGCETNVIGKIQNLKGILAVAASSKEATVKVEFDAHQVSLEAIKQAITDAGFEVQQ